MDAKEILAELIAVEQSQQSITYVFFASVTLALAETLQCFPLEVTLIWAAKWNLGKVLYLWARYLVFPIVALTGFCIFLPPDLGVVGCRRYFTACAILNAAEVSVAEANLLLRVYAIGGTNRRLGAFLLGMYLCVHASAYGFLTEFLKSLEYTPSPFPTVVACFFVKANNHMLSIVFIILLASEIVTLAWTFRLCVIRYRLKSPLVANFYKDGLLYYASVSAMSTGNIICNLVAPLGYTYLLACTQMVVHSILTARMVLHVRKIGSNDIYDTKGEIALTKLEGENGTSGPLRSMQFAAASANTRSKGGSVVTESGPVAV
ncbi:hypothetical protein DFP72DRAFT_178861 [Ephemerocybe angulata]|uniref:DUF6533 domain-containing protein n=1 Tax=Ephemerocybe angulata TaxID=980116 RepID=A0A8H6MB47_9AGAR|nr:hypothetical protein DFP72DRAFT_178861 [Tulosesus angulatus]